MASRDFARAAEFDYSGRVVADSETENLAMPSITAPMSRGHGSSTLIKSAVDDQKGPRSLKMASRAFPVEGSKWAYGVNL